MDKWDILLEYLQLVGALPEDVLELVADKFEANTAEYRGRLRNEGKS